MRKPQKTPPKSVTYDLTFGLLLSSLKDLEAQQIPSNVTPEDIEQSRSGYARSGRGGAGNYTDSTKLATATAATTNVTPSLQESKPPEVGHYGRGGAGNWRDRDAEIKENERRQSEAREKVHRQVVQDVEYGLKEPERAHLGSEKLEGYGRK